MTKEEILEGNTLIAEFIGYETDELEDNEPTIYFVNDKLICMEDDINYWETSEDDWTSWCYPEDMKYHSSWDWLMPVWNKILKFGKSEFGFQWEQSIGETFITINTGNHNKFKLSWLNSGEIKDVYYVIVEFIKWYNLNK